MSRPRPTWALTLHAALVLMAPFDLLASLAMGAAVVLLDGDTAWPLIVYPAVMGVAVLGALGRKP